MFLAAPIVAGSRGGACRLVKTPWQVPCRALIGLGTAFLLWRSVTQIACETRPTHTPAEWVVPALVIGGLVGAALAAGGLVASPLRREDRRLAAVGVTVLVLAFAVLFTGPGCERPVPLG